MTPPDDWQLDAIPDEFPPEPPPPVPAPRAAFRGPAVANDEIPSPEQLAEAMLFVGGAPLTPAVFAAACRVPERTFAPAIDALNRRYKVQNRPYAIRPEGDGFVLGVLPKYRHLREKLHGGPREARLTQPMLDTLSWVAYRQPVTRAEVDAVRGAESVAVLKSLVRLGLVAALRRDGEAAYGTTPRFLAVLGLGSLDDLPRLGDTVPV